MALGGASEDGVAYCVVGDAVASLQTYLNGFVSDVNDGFSTTLSAGRTRTTGSSSSFSLRAKAGVLSMDKLLLAKHALSDNEYTLRSVA